MVPSRTAPSRRTARAAGALTLALALAGGAAGCGSDDGGDATTATGGGSTAASTTATTTAEGGSGGGGGGGAPAADEGAIRAAIGRSAAAQKAAGTARIAVRTSTAGIETEATGTIDLNEQRFLLDQTVGDGSKGDMSFQNYGEDDKVYIKLPNAGGWTVTDNPAASSDPFAQVRQLQGAKITRVGGTKDVGGATCREFEAELSFADVVGAIDDPAAKQLLQNAPKGATVPVTACIDDRGLAYSSSTRFDLKELLGAQAAQLPSGTSTSGITISDYGTAPSPKRPAGIDDAKPLGGADTVTVPSP